MSDKKEVLHVCMRDEGFDIVTDKGSARYSLDGKAITKIGLIENLPDRLIITDKRTVDPAVNVTAESVLWGVDVKWQWPDCAGNQWYARVRADYENGEAVTSQGRRVNYPDCTYQVTGLPAGKEVAVTVTLHDGAGKQSKPVRTVSKSSDDANSVLAEVFSVHNRQVYIKNALIDGSHTYHLKCGVKEKTHEEKLLDDVAALVTEQIKRMLQPGGLLHGR
ncbi:hypothetical protein [Pantoea dispersa]|uniref:hypothetical protein n=1 Tax=Pantoea dispersa TaxID=59814 RepID=UPI0024AFC509|nr:hypothetical protein [Pantoea dispersa]MDI6637053.1 hypothetical protein [Pantoea dispersa]